MLCVDPKENTKAQKEKDKKDEKEFKKDQEKDDMRADEKHKKKNGLKEPKVKRPTFHLSGLGFVLALAVALGCPGRAEAVSWIAPKHLVQANVSDAMGRVGCYERSLADVADGLAAVTCEDASAADFADGLAAVTCEDASWVSTAAATGLVRIGGFGLGSFGYGLIKPPFPQFWSWFGSFLQFMCVNFGFFSHWFTWSRKDAGGGHNIWSARWCKNRRIKGPRHGWKHRFHERVRLWSQVVNRDPHLHVNAPEVWGRFEGHVDQQTPGGHVTKDLFFGNAPMFLG